MRHYLPTINRSGGEAYAELSRMVDIMDYHHIKNEGGKEILYSLIQIEIENRTRFAEATEESLKFLDTSENTDHLTVNWKNSGNLMAFVTIGSDFMSFIYVAWGYHTYWYNDRAPTQTEQAIMLFGAEVPGNLTAWQTFFWCVIPCCFLYPFMASYGVKIVMESGAGNVGLGLDEHGNPAPLFSWMSAYTNFLSVTSATTFSFFLTVLARTFACDYTESSGPATPAIARHSQMTTMSCWEGEHLLMVFLALVALLMYYPMASFMYPQLQVLLILILILILKPLDPFMYPQLQFCDKAADIKYTTSFVVFLNQVLNGLDLFNAR